MTTEIDFRSIVEPVARALLGEPNRALSTKTQLRFGSRGSLSVEIAGEKRGTWHDHEASIGGGVLDLIQHKSGRANGAAIEWLREKGLIAAAPEQERPSGPKIVATYDYRDASGTRLFQVIRREPKDFRQRRPDGAGQWVYNLQGVTRVLYRLPQLLRAGPHTTIYVVEGEKDCDALAERGLVATTNPGGSGKWLAQYSEALRGRPVVILPDNDAAGQKHAEDVAQHLAGIASSVRIVRLPDLPEKGDASDWLAAGGTAEELEELATRAPEWRAPADEAPADDEASTPPLPLVWLDDIAPALDIPHLVEGLLVERTAVVVYGESNSGKTFWVTDLALHIAAGQDWNGRRVEQGGVVYVALEGGFGFRNRAAAWRSKFGGGTSIPFAAITVPINLLRPDADAPRLISSIKAAAFRCGMPVRLVVIDTLSRALAGGNENSSEDMGALVRSMDAIRDETGAAVLFVHHSGKDQARGARGHSLLRAAIDTEVEIKDCEGERTATTVKQRDLPAGDVFGFSLAPFEVGKDRFGTPVTTCIVEHGAARQASAPKQALSGDPKRAMEILTDLIAESGQAGLAGVPEGLLSVSEGRWREQFYERAKPGAEEKTKQKAFRRAADALLGSHRIGMGAKRVWLPKRETI